MTVKIKFSNYNSEIPEKYCFIIYSPWTLSPDKFLCLLVQVENNMKKIFPSIQFGKVIRHTFSFNDRADEAYFKMWSVDNKEMEFEI